MQFYFGYLNLKLECALRGFSTRASEWAVTVLQCVHIKEIQALVLEEFFEVLVMAQLKKGKRITYSMSMCQRGLRKKFPWIFENSSWSASRLMSIKFNFLLALLLTWNSCCHQQAVPHILSDTVILKTVLRYLYSLKTLALSHSFVFHWKENKSVCGLF